MSDVKPCEICGVDIPVAAKKCKGCGAPQGGEDCRVCGMRMPRNALVCGGCKGYQDWRRRIPGDQITLALIVAVLSLLGTLVPLVLKLINLRSQTSGFFLETSIDKTLTKSDERSVITARLTNEGGRPSLAEHGRIDFGIASLPAADLEIVNRGSVVVPPEGTSDLKFFVYGLRRGLRPLDQTAEEANAAKEQLALALCSAKPNLYVLVRERSRLGDLEPAKEIEPISIPVNEARTWALERVVGVLDASKEKCE